MTQFIPKPPNRESILMFGDGDEAVFGFMGDSIHEGYKFAHFKPTKKMRWRKQIQDSEYSKDGWIKKIYKQDLCKLVNDDPDFPVWVILCDYHGNENTPLFNLHRELVRINRTLDRENRNYRIMVNKMKLDEKRRLLHPNEWEEEKMQFAKKMKEIIGEPIVIDGNKNQEQFTEE